MQIYVDSRIRIKEAPKELHEYLYERLTIDNPKYVEAVRMGRFCWNIPKHIYCCHATTEGTLILPRAYIHHLQAYLKEKSIPYQIQDNRRKLSPVDFEFNGKLKDFQAEACAAMLAGGSFGTLSSKTGSGKTVMALKLICERRRPALIIVHTKELLNQWIDRIGQFLSIPDYEVGIIGSGKTKIGKKITVALIQSLYKCARGVTPAIGHLIVDECHKIPSRTFIEGVSAFDSEFTLGLSATPYRRDGLTNLIFWYVGDMHHQVSDEMLKDTGAVLSADVIVRRTSFTPSYDPVNEYSKVISELTCNYDRNRMIAQDVAGAFKNEHGICLVLSDRKQHLQLINEILETEFKVESEILTGDLGLKKRREIVQRLNAGEIDVLMATGSLIGEGFDLSALSTLFLATPVKFSGRLLQYLGRVLRPAPGKEKALVYDYVDYNVGPLIASYKTRAKVYRSI